MSCDEKSSHVDLSTIESISNSATFVPDFEKVKRKKTIKLASGIFQIIIGVVNDFKNFINRGNVIDLAVGCNF
jgi:hypothetical protein